MALNFLQFITSTAYPGDRTGKSLVPTRQLITLVRPLYLEEFSPSSIDMLMRVFENLCTYQSSRRGLFTLFMAILVPTAFDGAGALTTAPDMPSTAPATPAQRRPRTRSVKAKAMKRDRAATPTKNTGLMSPPSTPWLDVAEIQAQCRCR